MRTFLGGFTNSGTISGAFVGVRLSSTAPIASFFGGITNSGTITGGTAGISVDAVTTFDGGIANTGNIHRHSRCH
jgi:hypothetical protein